MKILYVKLLLLCLMSLTMLVTPGIVCADQEDEINHLLVYIAQSNCTYIRNGKGYSAQEARDHIAGKYTSVKWRINSTETFIRKIASRSSLSGEQYLVICGAEEHSTELWLFKELENYRNQLR
ncbi:MAG: DUF5329 family protein [Desulfuromonadales bacterium]